MAINIPIVTAFADKGIKEAEDAFGKFGKTGVLVGAAFAAVSTAVVAGLSKSVAAAADDQRSQELLEKQLYNTLAASQKTTKATEDFVGQMELASGVADNQLRAALGNLVRSTGDLTTSQDLLTLSLDISAATGKDLETVSIALGKASMGQMTALQKLGIPLDEDIKKTKDFSKVQEALDKQFGGASAAAADTFGGQLARLGTVWDNLTESIGYAVINNEYVKDALNLLPDAASNAIDAIGEKGLTGALGVFLDQMGIVGAYAKRFGIVVAIAYNDMAAHGYNAISLLTLGLAQLVPAFKRAGDEINNNLLTLGLELDANTYYINDLSKAMKENAARTKATAAQSERWAQYVEMMGGAAETTTGKIDGLGGATAKVNPKIKEMADKVKAASDALDDRLNDALDKAKTNLSDARTSFSDFGKSVSDGLTSAFSFADAKTFGDETGTSFITGLSQQVSGIYQYSQDVQTLLGRGLSQESLQAVLAAGGKSGAAIARELVEGAQENITGPQGVNAFVTTLNSFATTVGMSAADKWYGAGVSNAQSYLDGIQAAFAIAQTGLAAPGLTLAGILGIGAAFDNRVQAQSVTPVTPSRSMSDSFGGVGGFFDGININITGGISTSAEIGEAVVNAIRAYNRAAGPANIAVA
jgi:hypothetical protein